MDTKKLRQKILDLAIRGKLVPQDPNDEPASVLLERIRAEKQQLIKEGKIKAPKGSKACDTSHYEKIEGPFEIPESWEWTTLGAIGQWQAGGTPSRGNKEYYGGNIPWLKTGDLNDGLVTNIPECITQKAIENSSAKLNPEGSILVAMYGATIGKLGILTFPATTNQACCACIEYPAVEQMYLFYFLYAHKEEFIRLGGGGAQPNISKDIIIKTPIPIPPINEQKRIVAEIKKYLLFLEQIEDGHSSLEHAASNFKTKVLDLAISGRLVPQDPSDEPAIELLKRINPDFKPCDNSHYEDLPIGWSICTLYDICDTINGLWKGKNPPFVHVGVIRNANFTKDFNLDYSKIEYIDVEQRAFEKRNLEDGDLIVEKSGGSDNFPVGRSILYQGESGKYSFSNFTMALRIKDKNLIRSRYLYFVILHKYLSGEMRQMQTQTTGLHNLLSDKYMSMPIPIPPTKEQDRIIDSIEKLLNKMNKIKTVL